MDHINLSTIKTSVLNDVNLQTGLKKHRKYIAELVIQHEVKKINSLTNFSPCNICIDVDLEIHVDES